MINYNSNRILVIKHGSLGDIVFAMEAMYSVRMHFKNSTISLLTEKKFEKFMTNSKYFDEIIIDQRGGFFYSLKIIKQLLNKKFNLVIDLQNSKRSNIYNFFFRYLGKSTINGNRSNSNLRYSIKPKGKESPKIGLNNQIKLLGIKILVDEYKWLNTNTGINDFKNLILMIPSTSNTGKHKQWPQNNFINLCLKLEKYGKQICLVGTINDKKITDKIVKNCKNILDLTGKSPPEIIFSIALNCQIVVTNDTGPGHIAALSKNKIIWIGLNNLTTRVNIEENNLNFKILSDKIENIAVERVFDKIKEEL